MALPVPTQATDVINKLMS